MSVLVKELDGGKGASGTSKVRSKILARAVVGRDAVDGRDEAAEPTRFHGVARALNGRRVAPFSGVGSWSDAPPSVAGVQPGGGRMNVPLI